MVGSGTSEGRTPGGKWSYKASARDVSGNRESEEKYSGFSLFCLLSPLSASPPAKSSWKPEGKVAWKLQLPMISQEIASESI